MTKNQPSPQADSQASPQPFRRGEATLMTTIDEFSQVTRAMRKAGKIGRAHV